MGGGTGYAFRPSTGPVPSENHCPYRKLNPDVLMVQSAQNWHSPYATEWFDGAPRRRVLVQCQARSGAIIGIGISSKQTPKMPLTNPLWGAPHIKNETAEPWGRAGGLAHFWLGTGNFGGWGRPIQYP